jgi:hypothetical protein
VAGEPWPVGGLERARARVPGGRPRLTEGMPVLSQARLQRPCGAAGRGWVCVKGGWPGAAKHKTANETVARIVAMRISGLVHSRSRVAGCLERPRARLKPRRKAEYSPQAATPVRAEQTPKRRNQRSSPAMVSTRKTLHAIFMIMKRVKYSTPGT